MKRNPSQEISQNYNKALCDYFWWFVSVCLIHYHCLLFTLCSSFLTENQMLNVPTSEVNNLRYEGIIVYQYHVRFIFSYLLPIFFNNNFFFYYFVKGEIKSTLKSEMLEKLSMRSFLIVYIFSWFDNGLSRVEARTSFRLLNFTKFCPNSLCHLRCNFNSVNFNSVNQRLLSNNQILS